MSTFDCEIAGCTRNGETVVVCNTFPVRLCLQHRRAFEKECQASNKAEAKLCADDIASAQIAGLQGGQGNVDSAMFCLAAARDAQRELSDWAWAWLESHKQKDDENPVTVEEE